MVLEGSTYKYVPDRAHDQGRRRGAVPQQERRPAQRVVLARQHSGGRGRRRSRRGMPDQMAPLEGQLITEPNGGLHGHLRRRAGGRVQVLLPAAPRAGHERQDHGPVVRPRLRVDPPAQRGGMPSRHAPFRALRATASAARERGPARRDPLRPPSATTHAHQQSRQRVHPVVHLAVHHPDGEQHRRGREREPQPARSRARPRARRPRSPRRASSGRPRRTSCRCASVAYTSRAGGCRGTMPAGGGTRSRARRPGRR